VLARIQRGKKEIAPKVFFHIYAAFAPVLAHAEHGDVSPVRRLAMHALFTHNHPDWRRSRRVARVREEGEMWPLVKEVSERVNDIGLAEFGLHEIHDIGKVSFATVLSINDGHGGGEAVGC
jgi:hypothetical protein